MHFQEVIKLQVKLEQSTGSSWKVGQWDYFVKCERIGKLTLVMETDDKSSRERTLEHEVDVRPAVLWDIAASNDTLLLELLVGKLVRAKFLVLRRLAAASLALRLAAHVVEV